MKHMEPTFLNELRAMIEKIGENVVLAQGSSRGMVARSHKMTVDHFIGGRPYSEIARDYGVTASRVQNLVSIHLRVLRYPSNVKLIRDFWSGRNPSQL